MTEFFAAIAVFLALHSAPRATGLREVAIARIGRGPYVALYSAASLACLAWVVSASLRAPYVELWPHSAAAVWASAILMGPACWLWASGAARANPLSIAFRGGGAPEAARGGALAWTRHPILWGFLLWALGHLVANGDVASAVLFGGSALFALAGMAIMDARARRSLGAERWARAAARPPFRARVAALATPQALAEIVAATALYAALLFAHPALLGVAPLASIGW